MRKINDNIGFAECCGQPPDIVKLNLGGDCKCAKCGKECGVWNGGVSFLRACWNRKIRESGVPVSLHGLKDFISVDLDIKYMRWASTEHVLSKPGAFWTERKKEDFLYAKDGLQYIIQDDRYLWPVKLWLPNCKDILTLNWEWHPKRICSYIWCSPLLDMQGRATAHELRINACLVRDYTQITNWLKEGGYV